MGSPASSMPGVWSCEAPLPEADRCPHASPPPTPAPSGALGLRGALWVAGAGWRPLPRHSLLGGSESRHLCRVLSPHYPCPSLRGVEMASVCDTPNNKSLPLPRTPPLKIYRGGCATFSARSQRPGSQDRHVVGFIRVQRGRAVVKSARGAEPDALRWCRCEDPGLDPQPSSGVGCPPGQRDRFPQMSPRCPQGGLCPHQPCPASLPAASVSQAGPGSAAAPEGPRGP